METLGAPFLWGNLSSLGLGEACATMFDYYTLRSGFLTRGAAQEYADTLPPKAKAKLVPYKVTRQYVQPSRRIRITLFAVSVCRWFIPER